MKKICFPIILCCICLSGCAMTPEARADRASEKQAAYEAAFDDGYDAGYDAGYEEGFSDGYSKAEWEYTEPEYMIDEEEYSFYENFAVCIDVGEKVYHKYNCIHFDAENYYIFNTEYAEYMGYSPCPSCN
ncbi:MAG: hypothetical protein IKW21_03320 [Lachnospiraceae bacterium]|nr:hypothetical protein [Lachnospiraceae bacterium]